MSKKNKCNPTIGVKQRSYFIGISGDYASRITLLLPRLRESLYAYI